jgi:hydrogenase small subunit
MTYAQPSLVERLEQKGVSRRDFLKFCAVMTATLALPKTFAPAMAEKLSAAPRPPVVWLEFQDCTADSESFLRSGNPQVASILLETISLNYHETLMVPAGAMAEKSLQDTIAQYPHGYIAIVEGSIPAGRNSGYCMIGGRSAIDRVRQVCGSAALTISVGNCATSGGVPGAAPNPTRAMGVLQAVPGLTNYLALPGCPVNVVNLTAAIVYYLTNHALPPVDVQHRPLYAYGNLIHDYCPRRPHFDAGEFVTKWGDTSHRAGYCLYRMGCRGPQTYHNCPTAMWNDATSWDVQAGHPCIGCSEAGFWDHMTPFYRPRPLTSDGVTNGAAPDDSSEGVIVDGG